MTAQDGVYCSENFGRVVDAEFSDLFGKFLNEIRVVEDKQIHFITNEGHYILYHAQDCCEAVFIEDIAGDVKGMQGAVITDAREDSNREDFPKLLENGEPYIQNDGGYTWTFYNLTTLKGSATFRWYGTSNGYYSETAKLVKLVG